MTFGQKFRQLREARELSMRKLATRAKCSYGTIWKIEMNQMLPKSRVLQDLCLRGLQLGQDSPEWEELRALWAADGTGTKMTPQMISIQASKRFMSGNKEVLEFFKALSKLPQSDWDQLKKAAQRPAVLRGLAALNLTYDEARK